MPGTHPTSTIHILELTAQARRLPHGLHVVFSHPAWNVVIIKPGTKGPDDFIVRLQPTCGAPPLHPRHIEFLTHLDRCTQEERDQAWKVITGELPPGAFHFDTETEHHVPGNVFMTALAWVLVQEDVNYPIARRLDGRTMFAERFVELDQGVDIDTVCRRATQSPSRLPYVDYTKVDRLRRILQQHP